MNTVPAPLTHTNPQQTSYTRPEPRHENLSQSVLLPKINTGSTMNQNLAEPMQASMPPTHAADQEQPLTDVPVVTNTDPADHTIHSENSPVSQTEPVTPPQPSTKDTIPDRASRERKRPAWHNDYVMGALETPWC